RQDDVPRAASWPSLDEGDHSRRLTVGSEGSGGQRASAARGSPAARSAPHRKGQCPRAAEILKSFRSPCGISYDRPKANRMFAPKAARRRQAGGGLLVGSRLCAPIGVFVGRAEPTEPTDSSHSPT